MTGPRTTFSLIFCLLFLLAVFLNTPVHAGCPRSARCSGTTGLRRDFNKTMVALIPSSIFLTHLTSRAQAYMNLEYNITDSCNPTCSSLALAVMADMNLTSSNWNNASFFIQRSKLLEFHRRVTLVYSQDLSQSLAELSRVLKLTTPHAYLKSLKDHLRTVKEWVTKAVKIDRELKGLPALNTTAVQQHSFTPMRSTSLQSQSVTTVACFFSRCVLEDLYVISNQMLVDFVKIKRGL
ncbi:hypothetical protein OS493_011864 [Desmophyllum pertusum]|uniref:Uncharacterized protein n=1 Tax=Desmophyllum pertusum TaxID=174260 RepID=A0A9W9YE50_9CNID|nr:hypothetical protein OS493_011864 [Desmophyllum pertusum]